MKSRFIGRVFLKKRLPESGCILRGRGMNSRRRLGKCAGKFGERKSCVDNDWRTWAGALRVKHCRAGRVCWDMDPANELSTANSDNKQYSSSERALTLPARGQSPNPLASPGVPGEGSKTGVPL